MVIESGPALVIEHGVVTTFGGGGLVIVLELPEDNFVVEWCFSADPDQPGPTVCSEATSVGLRLDCTNFDDASGRGSALPVLLGELGDELIFLHFRVFRHGQTLDRSVQYTFYRVAKDRIGWTPGPR
ncbi:MAG TPA: hypothetical protein ENK18_05165 [Deltaproteobacteria bacterium]|nr:hypothetical protein [Deltaproteobacteria bacterium]